MLQVDLEKFLQRMLKMSEADISVLEAALQSTLNGSDAEMSTAPGSTNDLLWSDMIAAGWMSKKIDTHAIPDQAPLALLSFKIEQPGILPIGELLERNREERMRLRKMVALYNAIYPKVVPEIVDPIRAAGGLPVDVITILAGVVAETINYALQPEFREQSLELVSQKARMRLRK